MEDKPPIYPEDFKIEKIIAEQYHTGEYFKGPFIIKVGVRYLGGVAATCSVALYVGTDLRYFDTCILNMLTMKPLQALIANLYNSLPDRSQRAEN